MNIKTDKAKDLLTAINTRVKEERAALKARGVKFRPTLAMEIDQRNRQAKVPSVDDVTDYLQRENAAERQMENGAEASLLRTSWGVQ